MTAKYLRGIELRYALTTILADAGPMSVADLDFELSRRGLGAAGRPSKAISDALRWEVRIGRVVRRGRGFYGEGEIPRSTEYRIRRRVAHLELQAEMCAGGSAGSEDARDDWFGPELDSS